jgi:Tol biopolymer transport system component
MAALLGLAGFGVPARQPAHAAFPGANGKIAFTRGLDGNDEIYVMNPDGSGQTRLTNQPGSDWQPAWSPDGTKISFVSERDGNHEIYVMNADGSGQTRLTNNPAYDVSPSWSPDGQKIAFTSTRDHYYYEIYVMNADGTNVTRLTFNTAPDGTPRWSPDGTKIGFTTDRDENSEIYVMNTDGTNQQNLTNDPQADGALSWSPDGTKIAFTRASSSAGGGVDNYDIFVMNADGSNPVNLTNTTQQHPLHGYEFSPAWAPDGSKIAFHAVGVNDAPGPFFVTPIFSMNANGSGVTRLTDGVAQDQDADWQPIATEKIPPVGGISLDPALPVGRSSGGDGTGLLLTGASVLLLGWVAWRTLQRRA